MVFGIATTLGVYYWFLNYGEFAPIITISVSLGYMVEYSILFTMLWLVIKHTRVLYRALIVACIWTAYEYIKSVGFLAFPWALLSHSVNDIGILAHLAQLTGPWGISFVLAYINTFILEWYLHTYKQPLSYMSYKFVTPHTQSSSILRMHGICLSVLLVVWISYGSVMFVKAKNKVPDSYLKVLLIQQNLDSWGGASPTESLTHIVSLTKKALSEIDEKPDLIVWSESTLVIPYQLDKFAYSKTFYESVPEEEPFLQFIQRIDIPILTGSVQYDEDEVVPDSYKSYNGATIILPDGTTTGFYGKNQLVPFAERLPFMNNKTFRYIMKNFVGLAGTWNTFGSFNTLDVEIQNDDPEYYSGVLSIGVPICFEDSFSYTTRNFAMLGANLIANITNVSWAKTPTTAMQQVAVAKFRSIETGLTSIRATNSGLTSIITPSGEIIRSIPTFQADYLYEPKVPLYIPKKSPLYLLLGDAIGKTAVIISIIYIFFICIAYHKSQKNMPTRISRLRLRAVSKHNIKRRAKKTR